MELLRQFASREAVHWADGMPTLGLHLDVDSKSLYYWLAPPAADIESRIAHAWSGWRTVWLHDQFERQLELAGMDIRLPAGNEAEIREQLLAGLRGRVHHKASNPARELSAELGEGGLNPWTDIARGSVGDQSDKIRILDELAGY